tara:strand:+ start:164967 stop:165716 length:750 start_codon:yes stop_codon:yes gene_type:complete
LITGAAQGIGLATARRYAAKGWFVGLYDVNREAIETLLASQEFPHACGGYCDVTDYESTRLMFEDFAEHAGGKLNLLVINAGVLSAGSFEDIDHLHHDRIIDVNVKGFTNTAHLGFDLLRKTPGATVINLCSASSIHGIPLLAVYSASKFYVNGLTEALALEWRPYDIRVTCVKPPVIATAMGEELLQRVPQKLGTQLQPEEVAALIEKAATGSGTSYLLGMPAKIWYALDKLLPNTLRHSLTRYLTGF